MTEYKIALVGFGGVNRALAQLIAERNARWQQELGFGLKIVGVTDLFLGAAIDRNGLDAATLAALPAAVKQEGLESPAIIVLGEVVRLARQETLSELIAVAA